MDVWPFYVGLVSLLLAAIFPLFGFGLKERAARSLRNFSVLLAALGCAALVFFASKAIYFNESLFISAYKILPVLEFSFFIDRLSSFFILVISIVAFCVSIYSADYIEHGKHSKRKNMLASVMMLFILSMILVVSSANTFSFLFFWELMSISSFFLVMFEYEKKETGKAGMFYFIMTQLSTVFLIFAFIILYYSAGTFDIVSYGTVPSAAGSFGAMPAGAINPALASLAFISLFLGFGTKAGVVPFHKWLPYAHPASPSNISALMSGVMIKVAIYGLMRFVLFVFAPELWWGVMILIAGIISAILGIIYALKEHDIKRFLAYSSIENVGIILTGFGLSVIFSKYGLSGLATMSLIASLFHTINHAIFKSLLFLTAGSVVHSTETRDIEEMGGLIKKMPYTALFFLIGAVSISALPPFNGFVSELMIFQALFQSGVLESPLMEVLLLASLSIFALMSALAAACFVKAFGITFLAAPRSHEAKNAKEAPRFMLLGPALLSALCIALGIFSFQIFSLLGYSFPIPNMLFTGSVLIITYALAAGAMRFLASDRARIGETWGCGILSQNSKMEYTASGFSEPITTIFSSIYKTQKHVSRNYFDSKKSVFKDGEAGIRLMKFFEEYIYMPIGNAVGKLSYMVSEGLRGDLDIQILLGFSAIIALIIALGWFA